VVHPISIGNILGLQIFDQRWCQFNVKWRSRLECGEHPFGLGTGCPPLEINALVDLDHELLLGTVHVFDDVVPFLEALAARGVDLAIVSNCSENTRGLLEATGLTDRVDALVLSCEIGATKPSPTIYRAALDGLGVDARDAVFVDDQRGFVVIRAPGDATRIIVVPTDPIEGIESPSLLREDAPNYWAYAWGERGRVAAVAPRPVGWDDIGMAINSRPRRTQDQMHIHVDCLDARLKKALAGAKLSTQRWSTLSLKLWGRYRVKRLPEDGLEHSVFQQVAKEVPGARTSMSLQTIAVVGVTDGKGERGFALLEKGAGGSTEEPLDHKCRAERR